MSIEIELRYKIENVEEIAAFVQSLECIKQKRIVDVYFDTVHGDLIKRGIFIRIRDGKTLDIKFNRACLYDQTLEYQSHCEEYSFGLPLTGESIAQLNKITSDIGLLPLLPSAKIPYFEEYAAVNKLIEHYIIDKTRASYKLEEFTLDLDTVKDLGMFLEIELMALDIRDVPAVTARMEHVLRSLKLQPLKTGYGTLLLKKNHFDLYLQSRFVLPEDKKLYAQAQDI